MNEPSNDLRGFAEDAATRAALLAAAGVLVTGALAVLTLKAAGTAIKVALGATFLALGAGAVAWEVRKVKGRLGTPSRPSLVP